MNRKQLISMWIGIILVVIPIFYLLVLVDPNFYRYSRIIFKLSIWTIAVIILTGGLLLTFSDKKDK